MRRTRTLGAIVVLALVLVLAAGLSLQLPQGAAHAQDSERGPARQQAAAPQRPLSTAFTYQGWLTDGGSPGTGEYDFQFSLHDDPTVDSPVAGPVAVDDHHVEQGLFTLQLDFGQVFTGTARYLEIGVRPGDSEGAYTTLAPRQKLTPAPYALALPGLWTQHNAVSPNLIGGCEGNWVGAGIVGATVGGGGNASEPNRVTDDYGTVGGGQDNIAGGRNATVGGGRNNSASDQMTTVGGGWGNAAEGWIATVCGGWFNLVEGAVATIGGGGYNSASGSFAAIGGGGNNDASATFATIGGGVFNSAAALTATIAGGEYISVTGQAATVAGGSHITVTGDYAAVGGGRDNDIERGAYATIGGGWQNEIGYYSARSTISGGWRNEIASSAPGATIGGGEINHVRIYCHYATIGGGSGNNIGLSSGGGTICGGYQNNIGDYSDWATIAGGQHNSVGDSSSRAIIPGGRDNEANGDYAFAAGRRAKANQQGAFVWADSNNFDFASVVTDSFNVRAAGGVTLVTGIDGSGTPNAGAVLLPGAGSWSVLSDRALKENLAPVDTEELLARLAQVPITTWNYKAQDASDRHMGPMAQDFYAAFGLGESQRHISTVDADGVALAAIQGLYAQNQELAAELSSYKAENEALREKVDTMEARLTAVERGGVSRSLALRFPTWLLLGGLILVGAVVLQRRRAGGEQ